MTFKLYSGVDKLYRRSTFRFAITAGMKVLALSVEKRPFKQCYDCRGRGKNCAKCGGAGKTRMAGGVWLNTRLFVKEFRSDRQPGQSIQDAVRRLAPEFEDVNGVLERDMEVLQAQREGSISDKPPPTGAKTVFANLACSHPNGSETSSPGWNQHLRAQKLGASGGFGVKRDPKLEEGNAGVDRDRNPEPNHGPECVGDGVHATRWMNGSKGWGHYDIPCPNQQCVFSGPGGVCKVSSNLNVITPHGLAQYQSKGADTGAGLLGLFGTKKDPGDLIREAAELGLPSLYGLPLALEISAKTKGAGAVAWGGRMVSMGARRFPVVDVSVVGSLVEFMHHQREMLTGRVQIALPPAPEEVDLIEADHDLLVAEATAETASRPGTEAAPEQPRFKPAPEPMPPARIEVAEERPDEPEGVASRDAGLSPSPAEGVPELYRRIGAEFKGRLSRDEIWAALEGADLKGDGKLLNPRTPWDEVKAVLDEALVAKA